MCQVRFKAMGSCRQGIGFFFFLFFFLSFFLCFGVDRDLPIDFLGGVISTELTTRHDM